MIKPLVTRVARAQRPLLARSFVIRTAQTGTSEMRGRRILVGYDASNFADTALKRAVDYSTENDTVKVLHIPNAGDTGRTLLPGNSSATDVIGKAKRTVWRHLEDVERDLNYDNVTVEYDIGDPTRDIKTTLVNAVDKFDADIIFIASRGLPQNAFDQSKQFLKDLLGSVPDYLIHNCSCDVVIAKPVVGVESKTKQFKVLMGYDGSEYSDVALRRALDYIVPGSTFRICHIPNAGDEERTVKSGASSEDVIGKARETVRKHCEYLNLDLEGDNISIEYVVEEPTTDVKQALIQAISKHGSDKIFVASRGIPKNFMEVAQQRLKDLLGSIPDFLTHHAPCDVVIVKPNPKYYAKQRQLLGKQGVKDYGM